MGKSKTLASTLGSSVLSTKERAANDYYATDPRALEMLLEREAFTHDVWEPACGEGNLSKVLTEAGYSVRSTDLIDRGYGTGGVDFLNETEVWHGDIVTNPPYIYALEFVKKSLDLLEDGHKTAFFLRLQFLEGKKRRVFFDSAPPPSEFTYSQAVCGAQGTEFLRHPAMTLSALHGLSGRKDSRASRSLSGFDDIGKRCVLETL